jgi:hypothetical protein
LTPPPFLSLSQASLDLQDSLFVSARPRSADGSSRAAPILGHSGQRARRAFPPVPLTPGSFDVMGPRVLRPCRRADCAVQPHLSLGLRQNICPRSAATARILTVAPGRTPIARRKISPTACRRGPPAVTYFAPHVVVAICLETGNDLLVPHAQATPFGCCMSFPWQAVDSFFPANRSRSRSKCIAVSKHIIYSEG